MDHLPSPDTCLPRIKDGIRLDRICPERLTVLHRMEEEEGFDRVTCRPVHHRTDEELLALYRQSLQDRSRLICGLFQTKGGPAIGKLTVSDYNPRNRSAELGYFLLPAFRGNGCMAKSLYMICELLLLELRLNKVYAQTGAFNHSSIRLLEEMGFRRDAVLRRHHVLKGQMWDDYIYSLLREEFPYNTDRME